MLQNTDDSSIVVAPNKALLVLTLTGVLWLITYWPTLVSMTDIWMRSDTYAHGAIIPLLSAWLIWRKRLALKHKPTTPCWPAAVLIIGNSLIWLMAVAVDVMAIAQLATVIQIPLFTLLIMGWRWTSTITFPLIYLLFSVPIGEELTLPLQNITADFTVTFLQMSGIPVYINGLFIEIPTGKFEVAEACSGIRYLIASFAIGTLYAYLSYNSTKKRVIFIAASLMVPIVANGIRAYMIVMIAHLSDMKYATGVDHLVY
ncbi:MAG: exosortase A, partial [Motiliproteus sp.]|nr:exosortase A [Motiliproteus sp.]